MSTAVLDGVGGRRAHAGRIGPNAIIQTATALAERAGATSRDLIFAEAGLGRHLTVMPRAMVDEADVAALYRVIAERLGIDAMKAVGWRAGELTGAYLLANRIPAFARAILPWLPRRLALTLLMSAISRHSWTFAGSGEFSCRLGETARLTIAGGPFGRVFRQDMPVCDFYRATFETIMRRLISPRIRVVETACEAMGAPACEFTLRFA